MIAAFFLPVWTGSFLCGKLPSHPLGRVEIRKIVSLVLAVMILAETGIHGVFSITDNGTANRDVYAESDREVTSLMKKTGADQVNYRSAIVNPLVRNEEMLYQLNGISMYLPRIQKKCGILSETWDLKIWKIVISMRELPR